MRFLRMVAIGLCSLAVFAGPVRAGQGDGMVWRSGTLVPKGFGYARQIREILEPGLLSATGGRLSLKTFYGGVLGDDEDFIRRMRQGSLEACGLSSQGALMACPQMGVVTLPFLFQDYAEVDAVKEALLPVFAGLMEKRGFVLILWLDQGFDQFYSTGIPLKNQADIRKARFLSWAGIVEEKTLDALGAAYITVPAPEVNETIRSGRAGAFMGPPIWCVATQLYGTVRFVGAENIRYSPGVFMVDGSAWKALPPEYRKSILARSAGWQEAFSEQTRLDNRRSLEALVEYGVRPVPMAPLDLGFMKTRTRAIWKDLAGVLYSEELLDQVLNTLARHRASQTE